MSVEKKFTVIARRWFDKMNGNTYHSVRCIRHKDNAVCVGPFQYGYGEHYKQTALEVMADKEWLVKPRQKMPNVKRPQVFDTIPKKTYTYKNCFSYERENNYPIIWIVSDGLKRDCVENGKL
jgi:hypothetical protein